MHMSYIHWGDSGITKYLICPWGDSKISVHSGDHGITWILIVLLVESSIIWFFICALGLCKISLLSLGCYNIELSKPHYCLEAIL